MLLRSITKHVKDQNWFAVGIDFFIVVVGVFIGIQVANWNDARVNRTSAEAYVDDLYVELDTMHKSVQNTILVGSWASSHIRSAIELFTTDDTLGSLDSEHVVDLYVSGYQLGMPLSNYLSSQDAKSYHLANIPNQDLRKAIERFDKFVLVQIPALTPTQPFTSTVRRRMPVDVISEIRTACTATGAVDASGASLFELPETCPPQLTRDQIERTAASFREADAMPDLREAMSVIQRQLQSYELLEDEVKRLAATIREHRQ